MREKKATSEPSATVVAEVTRELEVLGSLASRELARRHLELFGEPTRSNNREFLIRKLAWRIQENAFGGLTERARTRISELGDAVPDSWRRRAAERSGMVKIPMVTRTPRASMPSRREASPAPVSRPRDPRLPPVGAVLGRMYAGERHDVRVLESGFQYQGKVFGSLSQVARAITGTGWNGFGFFGLGAPTEVAHDDATTDNERQRVRRSG